MPTMHELLKRYQTVQDFKDSPPTLDELRRASPDLEYLFTGKLGETPNDYGDVVSWPLVGSREMRLGLVQDSTLGMVEPGEYEFPTEHFERITVLDGSFDAYVDGVHKGPVYYPRRFDADGDMLRIKVPVNSFYLCEYLPARK